MTAVLLCISGHAQCRLTVKTSPCMLCFETNLPQGACHESAACHGSRTDAGGGVQQEPGHAANRRSDLILDFADGSRRLIDLVLDALDDICFGCHAPLPVSRRAAPGPGLAAAACRMSRFRATLAA